MLSAASRASTRQNPIETPMSQKLAQRGTKRTCQACEARFYDLNRDPITCPMCSVVFKPEAVVVRPPAAERGASRRPMAPKKPVFVPEEAVVADVDLPEVADVADVAVEGEEAVVEGEETTFLPDEEEDTDVSGFIDGGLEEGKPEET